MRRHAEYQNWVAVYDSLSLSQRQELNEHLQTCQGCASDLVAYRQMDADIRSLRDERAAARVRVRFTEMVAAHAAPQAPGPRGSIPREPVIVQPRRVRQPWTPRQLLAPAAALILFVAAIWLGMRVPDRPGRVVEPAAVVPPASTTITEITFQCERITDWGALSTVISDFEVENPDVKVEFVPVDVLGTDEASYNAAVKQAAETADVFCAMPSPTHLQTGAARDLTPFIADDASFRLDDFYPGLLHAWDEVGGAVLTVPTYFDLGLIAYKPAAFDAADLSYPQPGWTWDEFLAVAVQLTQRQGDEVIRWGYTEVGTGVINRRLMSAWSSDWQAGPDYATLAEVLAWYETLYARTGAAPAPITLDWEPGKTYSGVDLDPYRNGNKSAMWDATWWAEAETDHLTSYPESRPGEPQMPMRTLSGLVLSGQTAHPDAGWRWISYLSQHLPDGEHIPARRSLAEAASFWSKLDGANTAVFRYALDHLAAFPGKLPSDYMAQMEAVVAVVKGEKTAEQALADLAAQGHVRGAPEAPATEQTTIVTMSTATPEAGATVIAFACWQERLPLYAPAVEAFEAANPGVHVQLKALEDLGVTPEAASMRPGAIEAAAAQVDTLCGDSLLTLIRTGAAERVLRDLSPFIASDASFDEADFYPGVLEMLQNDAQTWGIPRGLLLQLIYYNQYLFDQAGLSFPAPGWTWDDFLRAASTLTQTQADGSTRWGFTESWPSQFGLLRAQDARLLEGGTAGLASPETRAAAQWYLDLVKVHQVMPVPATYAEPGQSSEPGSAANPWAGTAMFSGFANGVAPDSQGLAARIGVAPFPVGTNSRSTPLEQAVDALAMSAATQHPEESWRWLAVASRAVGYSERWVPARRSRFEANASLTGVDPAVHSVYRYALEHLAPPLDAGGAAIQALREAIRAAMMDEMPVDEALRAAAGQ